jgi:hypothetical protein
MRRRLLFGCLLAVGLFIVGGAITVARGAPTQQLPAAKQAVVSAEIAADQAAQAAPHGTKGPIVTAPATCPQDPGPVSFVPFREGPFAGGRNLISAAHLVVNGASYQIYTGGTDANAQVGEVILIRDGAEDPCAAMAHVLPTFLHYINAPDGVGALSIVSLAGADVHVLDSAGHALTFDVTSETFRRVGT